MCLWYLLAYLFLCLWDVGGDVMLDLLYYLLRALPPLFVDFVLYVCDSIDIVDFALYVCVLCFVFALAWVVSVWNVKGGVPWIYPQLTLFSYRFLP